MPLQIPALSGEHVEVLEFSGERKPEILAELTQTKSLSHH